MLCSLECCGIAERVASDEGPVCTFHHVHPDADVHWFYDSDTLPDHSEREENVEESVEKSVEDGGWLMIRSRLTVSSDVPSNCSLKSSKSGRYITCNVVKNPRSLVRYEPPQPELNGVGSLVPLGIILYVSILIMVSQHLHQ